MTGGNRPRRPREDGRPGTTVVVPCRDEADFIGPCLDSILAGLGRDPDVEILVVDGMSQDGTRDIVGGFAEEDPRVRLLDNPSRITPAALNIGLAEAAGDVIVRMDAHSVYPRDYVRRCVEALFRHDADNVGGVVRTEPRSDTLLGRALVAVSTHAMGVGNAKFRIGAGRVQEVDTVPFGCYRRETLERLGGFDERLVRSQDYDLNLRLRQAGGRIVLVPDIVAIYKLRTELGSFLRHRVRDGFWTFYPLRFGRRTFALRHLAPAALLLGGIGLLASLVLAPGSALTAVLLAGAGLYALVVAATSLRIAAARREPLLFPVLGGLFPLLHLSYGSGALTALLVVPPLRMIDAVSPSNDAAVERTAPEAGPLRPSQSERRPDSGGRAEHADAP